MTNQNLPKISIDLATLLKPYKLATILSGLDKYYSEIYIPETIQNLVVDDEDLFYGKFGLDHPMIKQQERWFKSKIIHPDDWLISLCLLKKALDIGMVSFIETVKYKREISEYLGGGGASYADTQIIKAPEQNTLAIYSVADWKKDGVQNGSLEGLLYHDIVNHIKPIYGNENFVRLLKHGGFVEDIKDFSSVKKDSHFQTFLRCPEAISVDELFDFIKFYPLIDRFNVMTASVRNEENKRIDLALLFLEFAATTVIDTAVFKGLPASSGGLVVYKLLERWLKK